ncbi:MAG TPA: hypothetical protein VMW91_10865 [Desulfosporosinus sp.]|nr:hypothetical protein [Desulfosporosinus sp.]
MSIQDNSALGTSCAVVRGSVAGWKRPTTMDGLVSPEPRMARGDLFPTRLRCLLFAKFGKLLALVDLFCK